MSPVKEVIDAYANRFPSSNPGKYEVFRCIFPICGKMFEE
jgi:hypothetical protein